MTMTGGRGARERILTAAADLFYRQGITATGVEELADTAHVSKRTLYQHFGSKDELAVAYLDGITLESLGPEMARLVDESIPARDRLLGIFEPGSGRRGCPFLNASAELADVTHPARDAACTHKQQFVDVLIGLAGAAGASDPDLLGHQLAVLSDGARAQGAALRSDEPLRYARLAADALISAAVPSRSTSRSR
jgi:AcrR family transcriptional regulator